MIAETHIKTISILGSGWLGLSFAEYFAALDYRVKVSTRSSERLQELATTGAEPFIVDIDSLDGGGLNLLLGMNISSKFDFIN